VKNDTLVGSCVLLNSRYVLSVGHSFVENDFRWDTAYLGETKVLANLPYNHRLADITHFYFVFGKDSIRGRKIWVPDAFKNALDKSVCDIAVIELESKANVKSEYILNDKEDELSSITTLVGYGSSGKATQTKLEKSGIKLAGKNVIDSIGGFKFDGKLTILFCDMDSPNDITCNKMGSPVPLAMEYFISGGDSGGPVFRQANGALELIGLCKSSSIDGQQFAKTGYYGQVMKLTRLSPFKKWIETCIQK
jgi:secreted trypsin-like serine protease